MQKKVVPKGDGIVSQGAWVGIKFLSHCVIWAKELLWTSISPFAKCKWCLPPGGWGGLKITKRTMYKAPGTYKVCSVNFHPFLWRAGFNNTQFMSLFFFQKDPRGKLKTPINYNVPIYCLYWGGVLDTLHSWFPATVFSNAGGGVLRGGMVLRSSQRLERGCYWSLVGERKWLKCQHCCMKWRIALLGASSALGEK